MLAGVACAALMGLSLPAEAATSSQLPASFSAADPVSAFYATRNGAPLWFRSGTDSSAAHELIGILQRAALDGMQNGPALAQQAQALLARAGSGDPAALGRTAAELLFGRLAGDRSPPRHIVVSTRLVPRGSGEIAA